MYESNSMSGNKKTQKQMIEDLHKVIENLAIRLDKLERKNQLWPDSNHPYVPTTKSCTRCSGTGKITRHPDYPDWSPKSSRVEINGNDDYFGAGL